MAPTCAECLFSGPGLLPLKRSRASHFLCFGANAHHGNGTVDLVNWTTGGESGSAVKEATQSLRLQASSISKIIWGGGALPGIRVFYE